MLETILQATRETLVTVTIASIISIVIGFFAAFTLYNLQSHHNRFIRNCTEIIKNSLNITENIPYLIIILLCVPLIKYLLSYKVSIVIASTLPVTIIASIIFTRELSKHISSIPNDILESIDLYSASKLQLIQHILLPEISKKAIQSVTNILILIIGLSTIVGIVGAGGLGELALDKSLNNFSIRYLLACTLILYSLISIIRFSGRFLESKI